MLFKRISLAKHNIILAIRDSRILELERQVAKLHNISENTTALELFMEKAPINITGFSNQTNLIKSNIGYVSPGDRTYIPGNDCFCKHCESFISTNELPDSTLRKFKCEKHNIIVARHGTCNDLKLKKCIEEINNESTKKMFAALIDDASN